MSKSDSNQMSADAQLAWMEQHAGRILLVGALVGVNIIVLACAQIFFGTTLIASLLIGGLAVASFALLFRAVSRVMRMAVKTARKELSNSRKMMLAVEEINIEPAGLRGTVAALASSTNEMGLELYVWSAEERCFWSPNYEHYFSVPPRGVSELTNELLTSNTLCVSRGDTNSNLPSELISFRNAHTILVAPIRSNGELLGLIVNRFSSRAEAAQSVNATLVTSIAAIGAVAIGKAKIVDSEQQQMRDNELLLRSVHAASENRQRERLVDHIQQAVEAANAHQGALFALDSGRLKLVSSVGILREQIAGSGSLRLRSHLAELALHAGEDPFHCGLEELDEASALVLQRLGFEDEVLVQGLHDDSGVVGLIVLEQVIAAMSPDTDHVLSAIGHQASMAIERGRMLRSIRKRSRHLACTPKLARSLTGLRDAKEVARITAKELHEGFGFGRVSIALRDFSTPGGFEDSRSFGIMASAGLPAADDSSLVITSERPRPCSAPLIECAQTGRPYVSVCGDADDYPTMLQSAASSERKLDSDAPSGCRGRIVVPIAGSDRRIFGAIAVYEIDPDLLGEDDLHMLETVADQLGGTLEQAELFTTLERSYFETVEALSSALEAKDAYTLDHARSITDISADVGRRLGMREDEIRDLKLGALLHDIGKIGVPNEILSKNGPLTDAEFEVMKQHTVIGEQIISQVEFLQDVRPLVLHEHERWDGRGYPHGLKAEEIPLGARIIFVCDSWHAMTSDRPYRRAMPYSEAIRELRENAGTQFDPAVVEAFCYVMRDHLDVEPASVFSVDRELDRPVSAAGLDPS